MTTVSLGDRPVPVGRLPHRLRVAETEAMRLVAVHPALTPVRSPEVAVDVDVSVVRPGSPRGWAQLHSRHGLRGDRVAAVSSAGGQVEVAWFGVEHWQTELARAAKVPLPAAAPPGPYPGDGVAIALEELLAAGEAIRTHRADVLDELARRADGPDPVAVRDQLVVLHTATVGRLLATASAREDRTLRTGCVSWLLFADGWRALTPCRRDGRHAVRVRRAVPLDLGEQVAALVTNVRGGS
jgi:hypothetical protein